MVERWFVEPDVAGSRLDRRDAGCLVIRGSGASCAGAVRPSRACSADRKRSIGLDQSGRTTGGKGVRWGSRKAVGIGVFLTGVTLWGFATSTTFNQLLFWRVASGIAAA